MNNTIPSSGYFVDSSLLLLLVVGSYGKHLTDRHKRLQNYAIDDYDLLLQLLSDKSHVFVLPNTLNETSSLLAQHRNPQRTRLFQHFKRLICKSQEIVVASAQACSNEHFSRLGLTDSALLEVASTEIPLIAADLQ